MKAVLIDFKKKTIDIPKPAPYLRYKEVAGMGKNFEPQNVNFFGGVDKAYDLIELKSYNKANKVMTQRFFVNQDDIEIAFPIINAMVRNRTKNLEEEKLFAEISYNIVKKKYDRLKTFWFNKILEWIFERTDKRK